MWEYYIVLIAEELKRIFSLAPWPGIERWNMAEYGGAGRFRLGYVGK